MLPTFSGIWLSSMSYTSAFDKQAYTYDHYIQASQDEDVVTFRSVGSKSLLTLTLKLNDLLLTGTFEHTTREDGIYEGATYYGAAQLAPVESGEVYKGLWICYGVNGKVDSGDYVIRFMHKNIKAKLPDLLIPEETAYLANQKPLRKKS